MVETVMLPPLRQGIPAHQNTRGFGVAFFRKTPGKTGSHYVTQKRIFKKENLLLEAQPECFT